MNYMFVDEQLTTKQNFIQTLTDEVNGKHLKIATYNVSRYLVVDTELDISRFYHKIIFLFAYYFLVTAKKDFICYSFRAVLSYRIAFLQSISYLKIISRIVL